jgi:metallo-beta-lactamase family protein
VEVITELSGHADQRELLEWLAPVAPTLKKLFLVHGEYPAQQALKAAIQARYAIEVEIPTRGEEFTLA